MEIRTSNVLERVAAGGEVDEMKLSVMIVGVRGEDEGSGTTTELEDRMLDSVDVEVGRKEPRLMLV